MDIFFAGNYFGTGGPWNVNKNIVECLKGKASFTHFKSKILRMMEMIYKIVNSKVIVFSGISSVDHITVPIAKKLHKRIIYIMHGCLSWEYEQNNYFSNQRGIDNERLMLEMADKILCVSSFYKEQISERYPQYRQKLGVLTNGINWNVLTKNRNMSITRDDSSIVLIGGGRVTKRNLQVCQAVEEINKEDNVNIKVAVYGYYNDNDDSKAISQISCTRYHHVIPQTELFNVLNRTALFVQNSDFEPFSLGTIEALSCGCSVLVSHNVGAREVIKELTDDDVINDVMDISELKSKIRKVMRQGNNERLWSSIDKSTTSNEASVERLLAIAHSFI
ncbi:glycosyltransferase family 4 protein [Bacteroides sp. AN502(2024)]|uniref:glycosyltransferase family 4 protein n=1 Tax=Bacteroides sp. AN502(2024) TaxID=3160599 RepID=UPI003515FF20